MRTSKKGGKAYDPTLFRIDEQEHKYFYGLLPIPGLSEILQDAGLSSYAGVPEFVLEKAKVRGKNVHSAIHSFIQGEEPDELPDAHKGYLEAAKAYLADYVTTIKLAESSIHDVKSWTACTPDLLTGKDHLIEWKTSRDPKDCHAYQLAGQADMLESAGIIESAYAIRKTVVYLKANGDYEDTPDDFCESLDADMVWFSARTLYYAKEANKAMKKIAAQGREEIAA